MEDAARRLDGCDLLLIEPDGSLDDRHHLTARGGIERSRAQLGSARREPKRA
jgi:hypothetical protein